MGVSVVNALSEYLEVEVRRDGKVYFQRFERGEPKTGLLIKGETQKRGTRVTFKADPLIFEETEISFDIIAERMREPAFLNSGVRIELADQRVPKDKVFYYEGGLVSFVEYLNRNKEPIFPEVISIAGEKQGISAAVALQYNGTYNEGPHLCQQYQHQRGWGLTWSASRRALRGRSSSMRLRTKRSSSRTWIN